MRRRDEAKAWAIGTLVAITAVASIVIWIVVQWSDIVAGTISIAHSWAKAQALPWAIGIYAFGPLFLTMQFVKTTKDGVRRRDGTFAPAFWALAVVGAIFFEVYAWNDLVLRATEELLVNFAESGMPAALATLILGWPVAIVASASMILLSLQQNPARVLRSARRQFDE